MQSRVFRALLVVVAVSVGLASGYFLKTIETHIQAARAAADTLRARARTLTITVADVRVAQTGYVARGQGERFWMERVSTLLPALDLQIADFRTMLTSEAAQSDIESAAASVDNFHKLDARAQEHVKSSEALLASDLIFSDGLEAMSTASNQINAALNDELAARQSRLAELRRRELLMAGGGAGAMLLVLLVLGFWGGGEKQPTSLALLKEPRPEAKEVAADPMPTP